MRAGLFLAYWPWFTPQEQVELAVLADELGLDSVWISEAWGQDAVSVLGLLAGKTERVALGSGLFQIPARAPAATAMAAATLDVLSGGRFRLGLGVSGPQVSEGWYGVPFERPVARTREYVEIVRMALARKTVVHEGREYRVPLEGARPLKLLAKPVQQRIPVYLGAVGPQRRRAGRRDRRRLAAVHGLAPSTPATLFEPLDRGLQKAGRTRADLDVAACTRDGGRGRPRRGARRRAPVAGLLPRRDGLAREELLRRARRPRRPRRRRARLPGGVPRRRPRARGGGAHAGADRRDGVWPPRPRRCRSGSPRSRRSASTRCSSCRAAPTAPAVARALAAATA